MLSITTSINDVKVYNVTPGKSVPSFLSKKEQQRLQESKDDQPHLDIIQELAFPTLSTKARFSPDGRYLGAIGCYPPMLRLYDLNQTALKVQRNTCSEIIDFQFLSSDYQLIALIEGDRNVEFHNKGGHVCKLRVPRTPRCTAFDPHTPQLVIGGIGPDIYRIDLQEGRFRTTWTLPQKLDSEGFGINALAYSLDTCLTFAVDPISLTVYDARTRGGIVSAIQLPDEGTAIAVDATGLRVAVGLATSDILLYDIRSAVPLQTFTHHSDLPIHSLEFHISHSTKTLLSADSRSIRMFRYETIGEERNGSLFCTIEPEVTMNSFVTFPGSGLILVPSEDMSVGAFYVPELGPAPTFAAFLDNLAAELGRATQHSAYEDFYFISREELSSLNLESLIDSPLCVPYMHGYYIGKALYNRARVVMNPEEYKELPVKEQKEAIGTRPKIREKKNQSKQTSQTKPTQEKVSSHDNILDLFT
ncbi:Glycine-rich protein [Giardia muris]|uniref:Glycine-rich protein n=1 Tax=Giardia muris TaxID=5742 RepID=A0A4Z1SQS2_GIAMU|nr:Glycine-rich protein [Giardia muris]|eukprot:TNJ28040.1 Glycine-rich protein [Giardia muris]